IGGHPAVCVVFVGDPLTGTVPGGGHEAAARLVLRLFGRPVVVLHADRSTETVGSVDRVLAALVLQVQKVSGGVVLVLEGLAIGHDPLGGQTAAVERGRLLVHAGRGIGGDVPRLVVVALRGRTATGLSDFEGTRKTVVHHDRKR